MSKYLDNDGLLYFWQKLKVLFGNKVDKVTGKDLSTNDFTDALKTKLDGIAASANNYSHPTHTAQSSGMYKIVVDSLGHVSDATAIIKADITGLGIPAQDTTYSAATTSAAGLMSATDKTKLDAFSAASNYALKTDITSMYKHKGSVATTSDLPSSNNTEGDVYNVTATGMNYVWVVTNDTGAWDALGEVFTITSITNAEIDTILAA